MKLTKSQLKKIIKEEIVKFGDRPVLNEDTYVHTYRSLKDRNKASDKIWGTRNGIGNIGHPRVKIKFSQEVEKTGKMRPSSITIEGDKEWVNAYKNIAFTGRGTFGDVVKFVREKSGNTNA